MTISVTNDLLSLYMNREADLMNEMSDITDSILRASRDVSEIATQSATKRNQLNTIAKSNEQYASSTQFQIDMEEVQSAYELKMVDINAWETELERRKEQITAEIQTSSALKDAFKSKMDKEIQKGFSYGGASGNSK